MTGIAATVLADSMSPTGHRLQSFQVTAHRWILAEINTHKRLSRNYRSSRAVPVKKLIEEVRTNPAMPVEWRKNKPGMQAGELMTPEEAARAEIYWRAAAADAADHAEELAEMGLHKQWANRGLETYLYVHGVLTATEWGNFFGLRYHKDAQPEFRELAKAMYRARQGSTPKLLLPVEWHLPDVDEFDVSAAKEAGRTNLFGMGWSEILKRISAARCARVSYKVFDAYRRSTIADDLELAKHLMKSGHWSCFEHQATLDGQVKVGAINACIRSEPVRKWLHAHQHANFIGWRQFPRRSRYRRAI